MPSQGKLRRRSKRSPPRGIRPFRRDRKDRSQKRSLRSRRNKLSLRRTRWGTGLPPPAVLLVPPEVEEQHRILVGRSAVHEDEDAVLTDEALQSRDHVLQCLK